jgi:general secretion pathway protein M
MIARLTEWFDERTPRERRLVLLMLAIAIPVLVWLLIVRPMAQAYDDALEQHLEAVDRNGRVRMLADAAKATPRAVRAAPSAADLGLVVAEAAGQAGLALEGNNPAGANAVAITVGQAPARTAVQWLNDLETRGLTVEEWKMTPSGPGTISLSARVTKAQ